MRLFGFSTPVAVVFAIMFGVANGLVTIARGAVPLALFGPVGYGRIIGRIAGPALIITAIAPVVIAFVAERASDPVALAVAAAFAAIALGLLLADPALTSGRDLAERRKRIAGARERGARKPRVLVHARAPARRPSRISAPA